MVEDSEDDVLLVIRELKKGGYSPLYERVETAAAMKKALKEKQWDIILCDYKMPKFNAPSALAISKEENIDIPIIIVSGTIGEDVAVECMHLGARDYIMKSNLSRLCPAIARELEESEVRDKQRQAESQREAALEALRKSEQSFRDVAENAYDGLIIVLKTGAHIYANKRASEITGYSVEELLKMRMKELAYPDDIPKLSEILKKRMSGEEVLRQYETAIVHKEGTKVQIEVTGAKTFWHGQVADIVIFRNITERKKAEEALRKNEMRYRSLFDNMLNGFAYCRMIFDQDQPLDVLYLDVNKSFELTTGLNDVVGKKLSEVLPSIQELDPKLLEIYGRVSLTGNPEKFEFYSKALKQWLSLSVYSPEKEYFVAIFDIITESKKAEEAFRLSEENFRLSLEDLPLGVRIVTVEGETIYANQAILDIYGYDSMEEFKTTPVENRYTPESFTEYRIRREKRKRGDDAPSEYDIDILRKNGEVRHLHVFRKYILWNGERQFQVLYSDITERKQAEERIHASLREKEILLREVHHRVKNNMQVISGLLDLPAALSGNQERRKMFHDSQNRIHAMSLVHEKLYGSKDFARIDLAGYVNTLSQDLFQTYKIYPGEIDLIIQTDGDVYVDINKAIPCGLILNELISNALKHAFSGDIHGEIQIIIRGMKNTEIEIVVRDNGLGLPDDVDIHQPQSVGLHLVNGLAKNQLDGKIEVRRDAGTEIRIKFPL